MAWTTSSAMFREWPKSVMGQGQTAAVLPAAYAGLGADAVKAALFNSAGSVGATPNKDAALTSTGYNTGEWVVANEVANGTWVAGGIALGTKTLTTPATGVFMFDAADTNPGGSSTLSNVVGCLVYDSTITAGTGGVAAQGVCFNFFGGAQSVTLGTFTIVWNASGVFRITT